MNTRSNLAKIFKSTLRQYLVEYQSTLTDSSGQPVVKKPLLIVLAQARIYDKLGELIYRYTSYDLVAVAAQQSKHKTEVIQTGVVLLKTNQVNPLLTTVNHWMFFKGGIPIIQDYLETRKAEYELDKANQKYHELTTQAGTRPGDMAFLKLMLANNNRVLREATAGAKNPFITYVPPKWLQDVKRGQAEANASVRTLLSYCELVHYITPDTKTVLKDE